MNPPTNTALLVPAYANPCCDDGPNVWSSLLATAQDPSRNFELHVIFNPASGPGSERDPNYVNDSDEGPLIDVRQAGGIIHGYVPTGFGDRPIADVKADIDAYFTGHYAGFVDGIFFDEMSNDLADVGYYQELHAHVQTRQAGARTFGNPGTTFVNNPTDQMTFDTDDYVNAFDTLISFENTGDEYLNNYTSFDYLENLNPDQIGHIIHSQADLSDTIRQTLLDTAKTRGAGFLYITDDVLGSDNNPFDEFPTYWSSLTSEVRVRNECFLTGTLIATDRGDIAVETLKLGDRVKTATGDFEAIKWLGYQTFNSFQMGHKAHPFRTYPIRIQAGALGQGLPQRDLYVSPDHALLIDELLINAGALTNDSSIVQVPMRSFTYYHIELEHHALLLAEGTPAESYLPQNQARTHFDNGTEYAKLYPNSNILSLLPMHYPRVSSQRQLPRFIAKRLATVAQTLQSATKSVTYPNLPPSDSEFPANWAEVG